jgi:pilus assembly protein Flp/PilA
MSNFLANFVRDESGAAAAEYVLILAIVGSGVAAGAVFLGGKITSALTAAGNKVSNCTIASSGSGTVGTC